MRQFLAIPLPEELINHIALIMKPFRGIRGLKIVRPENLHLTLLFLGDSGTEEKFSELRKVRFSSFTLSTTSVRIFPERRPRLIWIGFKYSPELEDLHSKIAGIFSVEEKMNAHITLARVKLLQSQDYSFIEEKIDLVNPFEAEFEVNSFNLCNSELRPEGPVYRVAYRFQAFLQ